MIDHLTADQRVEHMVSLLPGGGEGVGAYDRFGEADCDDGFMS